MKPKVPLVIFLALVALFVFSTTRATGRRSDSGGPVAFILTRQPTLVSRVSVRLDQPLPAGEIILLEGDRDGRSDRAAGCGWDGRWMRVPPGMTCRFTIRVEKRSLLQFNSAKRLKLRLAGAAGSSLSVTLARVGEVPAGESPQAATLRAPASPADPPPPGARTPAPPTPTPWPTPTPVQFTVYDPQNLGQDWLLTLAGCQAPGEEACLVELAE